MIKRVALNIFVTVVLTTSLIGCGGGFEHDSDNAKNIEKSIFGPDSISNGNLAP
jgi:Na+/pantothenate symporter